MAKNYYLGKNKLEYATLEDAEVYGGGAVGIRKEIPAQFEYVPLENVEEEAPVQVNGTAGEARAELLLKAKAAGIKAAHLLTDEKLREKLANV